MKSTNKTIGAVRRLLLVDTIGQIKARIIHLWRRRQLAIKVSDHPDIAARFEVVGDYNQGMKADYDAVARLQEEYAASSKPDKRLQAKIGEKLQLIIDKLHDYEEQTAHLAIEMEKNGFAKHDIEFVRKRRAKLRHTREGIKIARNDHMQNKNLRIVLQRHSNSQPN